MPKRLHSLDTLRGLAALGVVLWHWQHFFLIEGKPLPGWTPEWEPFFPLLKAGYLYGWMAVDLFFVLSGFVFAWLYAQAIAARAITPGRFALLRFSRLYPLHVVTLIVVAVLQWKYHRETGTHFIYHANNLTHFLAALAFAQNWLHDTQSFNGPTWSVSVEVLIYIVFFALCRLRLLNWATPIAMIVLGCAIYHLHVVAAGRGLVGFFVGVTAFQIVRFVRTRPDAAALSRLVVGMAAVAWIVAIGQLYWPWLANVIGKAFAPPLHEIPLLLFVLLVAMPTVMALALHEQVLGGRYEKLSFLGDISYSTYLLHFPMQLILATVAVRRGWVPQDFMSPVVLIAFYAVLIALGWLSYRYFERPMQALIRGQHRSRFAPQPDQAI